MAETRQNSDDLSIEQNLNRTFSQIDALRTTVEWSDRNFFQFDDGVGRLSTYGGTGIYSGGEYDNFRRSNEIEDRRRQKYSPNPDVDADWEVVGREKGTSFDANYLSIAMRYGLSSIDPTTSPLSRDLGINNIQLGR